jgi:hypothetical protein
MLSLRVPRAGLVDPETCPVCRMLRNWVGDVIESGDPSGTRPVVVAMHTHMIYGHPHDPRNKTPAR